MEDLFYNNDEILCIYYPFCLLMCTLRKEYKRGDQYRVISAQLYLHLSYYKMYFLLYSKFMEVWV